MADDLSVDRDLADAVRQAMRAFLKKARQAVLGTRADANPSDLPPNLDLWPDAEAWSESIHQYVLPAMRGTWQKAYLDGLGRHADDDDPRLDDADYVDAYLRDQSERMTGADWPDEVYTAVRDAVTTSREEGEDNAALRERLSDILSIDPWGQRAETIARTETMSARSAGHDIAAKRRADIFGEKLRKRWLATNDGRTRASHAAAHGQTVEMDEPFLVGGEYLDRPHDPGASAATVVNCRCTALYVDDDEDTGTHELTNAVTAAAKENTMATWAETVAANAPAEPPAAWFENPQLTGPTKIRVTDEGRVYGHLAAWGVEHAAIPGVTVDLFRGEGFGRFHRHPIRTAEGSRLKTGPLSTGGHSDAVDITSAQAHYDDPNFVAADVRAGEDDHGIWVSGAVRNGASPFQVALLDRYSISGDWRDGELVAACSVTTPGFHLDDDDAVVALAADAGARKPTLASPTPRAQWADDGHLVALVAAGVVRERTPASAQQPIDGFILYRQFKQAQQADERVTAARRRLSRPRVQAAARRIFNKEG